MKIRFKTHQGYKRYEQTAICLISVQLHQERERPMTMQLDLANNHNELPTRLPNW